MSQKQRSELSLPSGFKPPHLLSGLPQSSSLLVGFSGGADSTALLHLLCRYAQSTGAKIYAAHVNHGIRGEEADRDEIFCRSLAAKLGAEFFSIKVNVPQIAKNTGESIETAARRIRYEYFDRLMQENNVQLLATAHNADDNLETIIFNIARGTGLGGICGIPDSRPCQNGTVIRPILNMEKVEIIEYCRQNSLDFVTDSTNTDTEYTRNRIRAEILPVMRQLNSSAVKNAARMSDMLREDSLCLESMSERFCEELRKDYSIETEKICGSPRAIVSRAIIRLYDEFSGGKTLEQTHVNALMTLAEKAVPHSTASLPGNVEGVIENGRLYFRTKTEKEAVNTEYSVVLNEGKNLISQTNCEIFIEISHSSENIYKNSILMSLDSAKIVGELYARCRQSGDRILMGGMHKSVKKLMCDKKVPLELRSKIPVICDNNGIIAIPFLGVRDGATYKKSFGDKNSETKLHFYLK